MKLLRYGPAGDERPGLRDAQGRLRDVSGVIRDGSQLSPSKLEKLASVDPNGLPLVERSPRLGPPVTGVGKFIAIGLNFTDHAEESNLRSRKNPSYF